LFLAVKSGLVVIFTGNKHIMLFFELTLKDFTARKMQVAFFVVLENVVKVYTDFSTT